MEKKTNGGIKELWRRFLVALKRSPQMIPMCALIITFLQYSLHLSDISDTTAKIQGSGMGLCGFCTMLFSMLSFMCCMNAFPNRKPVNKKMLALMFVMFAIIACADVLYLKQIYAAVFRADNPITVTENTIYIAYAEYWLKSHLVLLAITAVIVILLPVYSKLLRKIKTSVEVEDNGNMAAIDISGEA